MLCHAPAAQQIKTPTLSLTTGPQEIGNSASQPSAKTGHSSDFSMNRSSFTQSLKIPFYSTSLQRHFYSLNAPFTVTLLVPVGHHPLVSIRSSIYCRSPIRPLILQWKHLGDWMSAKGQSHLHASHLVSSPDNSAFLHARTSMVLPSAPRNN